MNGFQTHSQVSFMNDDFILDGWCGNNNRYKNQ